MTFTGLSGFSQRKKEHVRELFESRARAEDEAVGGRTPRNRLHVSSLVALLEERRDMVGGSSSAATARQLAEKYGMDVDRLEKLVRSVNVPSVREEALGSAGAGSVRHVKDADGDDIEVKEVRFFGFMGELLLVLTLVIAMFFFVQVEWKEPTHTAR